MPGAGRARGSLQSLAGGRCGTAPRRTNDAGASSWAGCRSPCKRAQLVDAMGRQKTCKLQRTLTMDAPAPQGLLPGPEAAQFSTGPVRMRRLAPKQLSFRSQTTTAWTLVALLDQLECGEDGQSRLLDVVRCRATGFALLGAGLAASWDAARAGSPPQSMLTLNEVQLINGCIFPLAVTRKMSRFEQEILMEMCTDLHRLAHTARCQKH